ncbi:MAG: dUTP diphosphatase [Proteobacteria bacterium]|nr:dUTP diphosphatase [Pseudomonadota bacterium]
MNSITLMIKRLPHLQELPLPSYATIHSAGMDLLAATSEDVVLQPMQRALIPTGISIALPQGYEAQIRPRSGLALKHGITVLNAPGTIDADYRGEVQVLIINLGQEPFTITRGMRFAQLVVAAHGSVNWNVVSELPDTERSQGGFGSTGSGIKAAS